MGCTAKVEARFCGKKQCLPMLNLACGDLVGQQTCMACADNTSRLAAKEYRVSCDATAMIGFCGSNATTSCDAALQHFCGAHVNSATCHSCVANKTYARELADAG